MASGVINDAMSNVEAARTWFAAVEARLGGEFKNLRTAATAAVMDAFDSAGVKKVEHITEDTLAAVAKALKTSVADIRKTMGGCPYKGGLPSVITK